MSDITPARVDPPVRVDPAVPGPYQQAEEEKQQKQAAERKTRLSPDELRKELDAKTQLIHLRIEAIKGELSQVPNDAKEAVQKAVFRNPLVAVGGSLALGLLVGLIVGKRKVPVTALSQALSYVPTSQRHLAERYVHDLERAMRRAERRGESATEAAQEFLSRHAPPVIVVEEPRAPQGGGLIGALGGIAVTLLSTLGRTALQTGITALTAKVGAEEGARAANRDA